MRAGRGRLPGDPADPGRGQADWPISHPDLPVDELAAWFQLVKECQWRIERGEIEDAPAHLARPFGHAEAVAYIKDSAAHLRAVVAELGQSGAAR